MLPKFAEDPRGMLAIGITEPDNASNYFLPYPTPFRTSATQSAGRLGRERHEAFHLERQPREPLPALRADRARASRMAEGSTCFLLERDRPGFTIGRVHDKMGERLANNAELVFQDCFIPDENVVGRSAGASSVLAEFFPQSNAYAGATVIGVAGALHEKAIEWARLRVQGGKPLIEHGGIRAQLAEMRMLIDASRSYVHRACWLADHQEHGWDKTLGALPKAMAAQAAGRSRRGRWRSTAATAT